MMGDLMNDYLYPTSVEEAVACLARRPGAARVIAGGTDVLPDLRKGRIEPCCLVDVTRIPALQEVSVEPTWVTVGAAVTFATLREHPFLREHVHALVEAAGSVGAAAIQNAATWVGNIVQAMPAADGAIVAVALGAEAEVVSAEGARWEPVEDLFEGPGCSAVDPQRELVTRIRFPRPTAKTGTAWRRVGRRRALVLPILNCAVRVELEDGSVGSPDPTDAGAADQAQSYRKGGQTQPGREGGHTEDGAEEDRVEPDREGDGMELGPDGGWRIADVAIALGPVAPVPSRAREAEAFLRGRCPRREVLRRAGEIARREANPRSSVMRASRAYRRDIVPTLVTDALVEAVERARGPSP